MSNKENDKIDISKDEDLVNLLKDSYFNIDHFIGYPACLKTNMYGFAQWYEESGISEFLLNNAGNPYDDVSSVLNTLEIEKKVISSFSQFYGIEKGNEWGFVTCSGTDGNMHGIYFGAKMLQKKTGMLPIVYVNKEAHYSTNRICDVQNLESRLINFNTDGSMNLDDLRRNIDPNRPALIICAMGSTFMGAIDDIRGINTILDEVKPIERYIHVDAALFGGYLPFSKHSDLVNMQVQGYDSISISGHKFFGIDEPCGLFLSRKEVIEAQTAVKVEYLNNEMPLISCSRSGQAPLKFYWILKQIGAEGFRKQANQILENTEYLQNKFNEINYPAWHMRCSNTVFFKRPSELIRKKYSLANGYLPEFGGEVCHIVVMQHVSKDIIDEFIQDLTKEIVTK